MYASKYLSMLSIYVFYYLLHSRNSGAGRFETTTALQPKGWPSSSDYRHAAIFIHGSSESSTCVCRSGVREVETHSTIHCIIEDILACGKQGSSAAPSALDSGGPPHPKHREDLCGCRWTLCQHCTSQRARICKSSQRTSLAAVYAVAGAAHHGWTLARVHYMWHRSMPCVRVLQVCTWLRRTVPHW